jgi:hypothetical protein
LDKKEKLTDTGFIRWLFLGLDKELTGRFGFGYWMDG